MNQVRTDSPDANPTLSDAELRAAIYFAVGVTSESGERAYMLAVAGDVPSTPRLEPADNSGYSIGTIQTDLGQHYQPHLPNGENVPRDLVNAYQIWATRERPLSVLTQDQVAQTIADLGRNGREIKAQGGRELDPRVKADIDVFMASAEGITWVHGRDVAQVEKLMRDVVPVLQQSDLYRNAPLDDQVRLAVVVTKAYNQNERLARPLLANLRDNRYGTPVDLNNAVDGLSSRARDYFETGRDKALEGARVINALRNADAASPLGTIWAIARDNAITNPIRLHDQPGGAQLTHAYPVVRNLFVQYDRAPRFIDALDRGGTYAYGRAARDDESQFSGRGLFVAGNDFVAWNASGKGHAYTGGEWHSLDRADLVRTARPRRAIDIDLNTATECTRLLVVDPAAPPLRPAVAQTTPTADLTGHSFLPHSGQPNLRTEDAAAMLQRHPLLQQAQAAVRHLDTGLGREYDSHSACMAASAACLAKANGLSRIDHIVLSEGNGSARKGENLFVVQGALDDPANHWAQMKTQEAVTNPVDKSLAQLQSLETTQQLQSAVSMDNPETEIARQPRMV